MDDQTRIIESMLSIFKVLHNKALAEGDTALVQMVMEQTLLALADVCEHSAATESALIHVLEHDAEAIITAYVAQVERPELVAEFRETIQHRCAAYKAASSIPKECN